MAEVNQDKRIELREVAANSPDSFVDGPFGSNLKTIEYVEEGVRLIQLQNIGDGHWVDTNRRFISERKYQTLERHGATPGDIAIAKMADPVARACVLPRVAEKFLVVADCVKLRPDPDRFDANFVCQAINSHQTRREAETKSSGTTRLRINLSVLKTVHIWAPLLSEQRRIAEILNTASDAILRTEQLIAKLQQMKQGVLHDLLMRGIDESGALRDPERHPDQFKDSAVGRVPTAWRVARLVDTVALPSGQLDPRLEPYRSWPLIAPDHIEVGTGRLLAKVTAASQGAISGKYAFRTGDVLYSKIRPYLRKATLADCEGLCSADMYPLRPGAQVRSRFLLAVILGEDFSRFAESVSMRSGFPKINRAELGEYSLGLPDLAEQDRVGQVLSSFDDRIAQEESLLSKLRPLRQGLTEDLLTGRVRVTKLLEGDAA